jgi:ABC-type spermidine/putrescine transport system permease subunit II
VFADTVTEDHVVLGLHVATVIVTFGAIFARPLVFAVARRQDPGSLPVLHRIECAIERWLVAPGLIVAVVTGAYLAGFGEHWSAFYVKWGIGVVVLVAVALPAVLLPAARRARTLAERDLRSAGAVGASGLSAEYLALDRRIGAVGALLGVLVLVTFLFMGTERPY